MTTTKFSPGQRVRVYERSQHIDGVVDGIWPDGSIRVKLDSSSSVISYHPKQCRLLKKRKKVVWESENIIQCRTHVSTDGSFDIVDAERFCYEVLYQFLGKRVRIEITEAKPQEKAKL